MKVSSIVLAVSIAGNFVLAGAVVFGLATEPDSKKSAVLAAPAARPAAVAVSTAAAANAWAELKADDLKEQAEKLRADGFPPAMLRAIIGAQIRAGFAARRKALDTTQGELPFWRVATPDPANQAALRALAKDELKAIKDVLGPDPENSAAATLRRQFPDFSPDTIEQLGAIRERYDQQRSDLYAGLRGPGGMLPDEQAKIEALDKAMHAEFAAVLSPAELENYDLRTSNTANQLRYEMQAFDPTEQEFRAVYKLKSAFDDQFGQMRGMLSEDQSRARSEGQKLLNEQIKAALGPSRYEEYQRASDYNYRQTTQLMARLSLPPETANNLYTIQKEIEQRRNDAYRSNSAPSAASAASRTAQLTALQQDAIARVTQVLGNPQHVEAYKQYGGSWITNLVPRPVPPR